MPLVRLSRACMPLVRAQRPKYRGAPCCTGTFPPGDDLVEAELRRIFNVNSEDTFDKSDVDELKVRSLPCTGATALPSCAASSARLVRASFVTISSL